MQLITVIESVLSEQKSRFRKIEVNITIANGNITLNAFHIFSLDRKAQEVKGLTAQEEYAYAREGREPVFCILKLDEIKELVVSELEMEYSQFSFAG